MKDDTTPPDDFNDDIAGWHQLLGWGDDDESVAPYVPTPMSVVRSMLELIELDPVTPLLIWGVVMVVYW